MPFLVSLLHIVHREYSGTMLSMHISVGEIGTENSAEFEALISVGTVGGQKR